MVQLLLGALSFDLLLLKVGVLHGSILVKALLMVPILNTIFELDILGVLNVKEHVLRKYVDDRKNVQNVQRVKQRLVDLDTCWIVEHFSNNYRHQDKQDDVHD